MQVTSNYDARVHELAQAIFVATYPKGRVARRHVEAVPPRELATDEEVIEKVATRQLPPEALAQADLEWATEISRTQSHLARRKVVAIAIARQAIELGL